MSPLSGSQCVAAVCLPRFLGAHPSPSVHRLPSPRTLQLQSQVQVVTWTSDQTSSKSKVPTTPSLGAMNLLELPCPLPAPAHVHQPGDSPKPDLMGVYGGFITQAQLIKPLAIGHRFNLQPLPSLEVGVGLIVSTLQSVGWFPWQPAPSLT